MEPKQHSTRKELSHHITFMAARDWAWEHDIVLSRPGSPTAFQIRKKAGFYVVVERVPTKQSKAA